jgi:hypothetical protein
MTAESLISALSIPAQARVDQRVAKKLLVENGAATPTDKRWINDGIEELTWIAALKPTTIGVAAYSDSVRDYLEIAVLSLTLRPDAKTGRLIELVHRAIPYPVFLITSSTDNLNLSAAHKRHAQNEADLVVLDDDVSAAKLQENGQQAEVLQQLSLKLQPKANLFALYQGWLECIEAINAFQITGRVLVATDPAAAAARREALAEHSRLTRVIAGLKAQAQRESQIPRRVELNLEIKRLEAALRASVEKL